MLKIFTPFTHQQIVLDVDVKTFCAFLYRSWLWAQIKFGNISHSNIGILSIMATASDDWDFNGHINIGTPFRGRLLDDNDTQQYQIRS